MSKATKTKNPCIICCKRVKDKNGIQCQGACKKWAHFSCLAFTPERICKIKKGIEDVVCACPGCEPSPQKNKKDNCLVIPEKAPEPCPSSIKVLPPISPKLPVFPVSSPCCPKCNCSKANKKKEKGSKYFNSSAKSPEPCPSNTEVRPPCCPNLPSPPPSPKKKTSGSIYSIFKKKAKSSKSKPIESCSPQDSPKAQRSPQSSPKRSNNAQKSCQTPTKYQCLSPSQSANSQEVKRSKVHKCCQMTPTVSKISNSPCCFTVSEDSVKTLSSVSCPSFERETRSDQIQCPSPPSQSATSLQRYPKMKSSPKDSPEVRNFPQGCLKVHKSCQMTVLTPIVSKIISKPSVCFTDSEVSGKTSFSVSCPSVVAETRSNQIQCPSALLQSTKLYPVQPCGEQNRKDKGSSCLGQISSLSGLLSSHYIECTLERIAYTLQLLTSQAKNLMCELQNRERQRKIKKY